MSQIQTYSFNFIEDLSNNFKATLDQELVDCLMEIKKHNKFIKRKSPIKLKYVISTSEKWRNERESNENISQELQVINNLQYNLNKISDNNFKDITDVITQIFKKNYDFEDKLIGTIFEKGINENMYSSVYGNLVYNLDLSCTDKNIKLQMEKLCNNFISENINKNTKLSNNYDNYEELCKSFKEKEKFVNGFKFISSLFNYSIVEYDLILTLYKNLEININNSNEEYKPKFLDTLICVLNNSGENLYKFNKNDFDKNFMNYIYSLVKNKDLVKAKYRFKLMDLIDLYKNKWNTN